MIAIAVRIRMPDWFSERCAMRDSTRNRFPLSNSPLCAFLTLTRRGFCVRTFFAQTQHDMRNNNHWQGQFGDNNRSGSRGSSGSDRKR
jgi:hypothetical protein